MFNTIQRCWAIVLFFLISAPFARGDLILNFEGLNLNNGGLIPQTYGDTGDLDVTYSQLYGFGNANVINPNLFFWGNGYGDLSSVVYGYHSSASLVGQIRFESLSSMQVRLNSFDAADWGSANNQTFRVYDGNYNLLYELTNLDVNSTTRDTFSPNVAASTLILQWDYPYHVALDNLSISMESVPEPSSFLLMGVCFTMLVFRRRRNID